MAETRIEQLVAQAVGVAFDKWAAQHPSLAGVIDRTTLDVTAAASLRQSTQFNQAVAGFYRGRSELELLNQLADLAGPIITALLAG